MSKPSRDRFDDVPRSSGRVGAHRAEAPGMNGWVVLLWSFVLMMMIVVFLRVERHMRAMAAESKVLAQRQP